MALKSIRIENFKSIGEIEIVNPQPFSVLVGANASGKSNIFAALQFLHHGGTTAIEEVIRGFGGQKNILHINSSQKGFSIWFDLSNRSAFISANYETNGFIHGNTPHNVGSIENDINDYYQFVSRFTRLFVSNPSIVFQTVNDDSKLSFDAKNLEQVLKRLLNDSEIRNELIEALQLFIPGLDRIEVTSSEFSSRLELLVYEKALKHPINRELISDGTYNIIAILTALYQSKEPQFLCIEEPENGLNPYVLKELVEISRYLCEQYGHYIWFNTHSQSIVSQLKPEEIILVNKVDGFTKIKQFEKGSFGKMPMDEAWLTNTLGGGLPW